MIVHYVEECPKCRGTVLSDNVSSIFWDEIKVDFTCPACGCEFTVSYSLDGDTTVTKDGKDENE